MCRKAEEGGVCVWGGGEEESGGWVGTCEQLLVEGILSSKISMTSMTFLRKLLKMKRHYFPVSGLFKNE